MYFLFLLCTFHFIFACDYSGNAPPAKGQCKGPMDRAFQKHKHAENLNHGCPIDKVAYAVDANPNEIKCGECIPGSTSNWQLTGVPSQFPKTYSCNPLTQPNTIPKCIQIGHNQLLPTSFCKLNHYCNDSGSCVPLSTHPFFGKTCFVSSDYNQLANFKSDICGLRSGLFCIDKTCQVCYHGSKNGKSTCLWNNWYTSEWAAFFANPFLFSQFLLFLLILSGFVYISGLYHYLYWIFIHWPWIIPKGPFIFSFGSTYQIFYFPWYDWISKKRIKYAKILEDIQQSYLAYGFTIELDQQREVDRHKKSIPQENLHPLEQIQDNDSFDFQKTYSNHLKKQAKRLLWDLTNPENPPMNPELMTLKEIQQHQSIRRRKSRYITVTLDQSSG